MIEEGNSTEIHSALDHCGHICYQWQAMWNQAHTEIKLFFKVTLNWADRNTTCKKEKEMDFLYSTSIFNNGSA